MHKTIEEAIQKAERQTTGEIVPVVCKASDTYPAASWRFAFVFSIVISAGIYVFYPYFDTLIYFLLQLPLLLAGLWLAQTPGLKRYFLSKVEIEEETHQRAIEAFYEHNLHTTQNRTGILIFVSLLEHKIHVLADCGIHEKVSKNTWNQIVHLISIHLKQGHLKEGLKAGILKCGEILAHHFPKTPGNPNELPNKLITEE